MREEVRTGVHSVVGIRLRLAFNRSLGVAAMVRRRSSGADELFEVEKIVGQRARNGRVEYEVITSRRLSVVARDSVARVVGQMEGIVRNVAQPCGNGVWITGVY